MTRQAPTGTKGIMKIAVLGTGMVGRALAARLTELGHEVVIGTRDVDTTLARTDTGNRGTPPLTEWLQEKAPPRRPQHLRRR